MGITNPVKLLLLSLIIWLFFYVQIPGEYKYTGTLFYPILTLIFFIISFICGTLSLKFSSVRILTYPSERKLKQIIYTLFLIGFVGVLLKVYVGFFKSEIFIADDIFEQRLENMGKELTGGFVGIIAAILFPFSFVALLMVIYNYRIFRKTFLLTALLIGSYPFIETIFMGGRTTIALLGTTLIFVLFASYSKNSKIPTKRITWSGAYIMRFPAILLKKTVLIPLILVAVVFTIYSIDVINNRLKTFGYGSRTLSIWEQKDYQWIEFDKAFKTEYYKSTEDEQAKMVGLYSLNHYFAHGMVEYVRMVNHLEHITGYYYGQYEFNVFFKFFRAFGIPLQSETEMQSILKRQGVYSTFFGPFYIDFGVFGFFILFFWGRFVKRVYIYAKNGHTQYVVFYGYLTTIIITSAFINFLLGSSSYYLFAFFVSLLLFKLWPNKLVLKRMS